MKEHDFFFRFYFLFAVGCAVSSSPCGLFSSCREQELVSVAELGLLVAMASLALEHRLRGHELGSRGSWAPEQRLNSCGARAQLLHFVWDLPDRGSNSCLLRERERLSCSGVSNSL